MTYAVIGRKMFKKIANKIIIDNTDITIEKKSMQVPIELIIVLT